MTQNLVAGCVLAAMIFMGVLGYAQKHHECWHGHLIKTLEACGSIGPTM